MVSFLFTTSLQNDSPFAVSFPLMVMTRHHGRLNALFCDGHTLAIKVHSLLFDHSDDALRRWNNDHEPHRELLNP